LAASTGWLTQAWSGLKGNTIVSGQWNVLNIIIPVIYEACFHGLRVVLLPMCKVALPSHRCIWGQNAKNYQNSSGIKWHCIWN